jgi:hypothetical protein
MAFGNSAANNLACKIYSEWSSCRYPGYFDVVDLVNRQPDDSDGRGGCLGGQAPIRYMPVKYMALRRMRMRHTLGYTLARCMLMRCMSVRYTPMRCTPVEVHAHKIHAWKVHA